MTRAYVCIKISEYPPPLLGIGVVGVLVKVLNNSSSECVQGRTVDQDGGKSFPSLAVLGKNECLCTSILEYGMGHR